MSTDKPGFLRRSWTVLRKPSAKYSVLTLLAVGVIGGIVFWGGFNTAIEETNSLQFCTSCHEMRDTVFQEYKESSHYKNKYGVRAICSDCLRSMPAKSSTRCREATGSRRDGPGSGAPLRALPVVTARHCSK